MIFVILSKKHSIEQEKIVDFIRINIKHNNFNYKILFVGLHIFENDINFINKEKDIILWEPIVAHNNLEVLKEFQNSIVVLEKPSVYIQKISKHNPINENTAINHGFYLIYINPDDKDITNDEWKLVVKDEMFLMTLEKLKELILEDSSNIKQEKIYNQNVFDSIINFTKNQINLS